MPTEELLPRQVIERCQLDLLQLTREPQVLPILRTLIGPVVDNLAAILETLDVLADADQDPEAESRTDYQGEPSRAQE